MKNLLQRLLTADPASRITWEEFYKHDVFTKSKENHIHGKNFAGGLRNTHKKEADVDEQFFFEYSGSISEKPNENQSNSSFSLSPFDFEEAKIEEESEEQLRNGLDLPEECGEELLQAFDVYEHECNKVVFLYGFSKQLVTTAKNHLLKEFHEIFFMGSFLICKKARAMAQGLLDTINYQKNDLNLKSFRQFCESKLQKSIYEKISKELQECINIEQIIKEQALTFIKDPSRIGIYKEISPAECPSTECLNELLVRECILPFWVNSKDNFELWEDDDLRFQIGFCMVRAHSPNQFFPFTDPKTKKNFDWDQIYEEICGELTKPMIKQVEKYMEDLFERN